MGGRLRYQSGLVWALAISLASATFTINAAGSADDKRRSESENESEEHVYDLGDDITPPRLVHHVDPDYSPGPRGVRLEGTVIIGAVISSTGAPKKLRVVKSLDKDVDQAAVDAVKQWLFSPGKKSGKPVAVNVQIEIRFHSM
jgi:TonB family protein